MTRGEFINGYLERSGLKPAYRTADGFEVEGCRRRVALPCTCGEPECEGWAMIADDPEEIEIHLRLYGPTEESA